MLKSVHASTLAATAWLLAGALLLSTLALIPTTSRAMEFIPSLGMTKSTDTNAGDAKFSGGIALRAPVLPFLKLEGGITYRQDSYSYPLDQSLTIRMWPVTASAWLTPFPMLYAGGGLGWYRTTYDFSESLPLKDKTTETIGVHVGGGVVVPLASKLGLDLNGRYIFMERDKDLQLPTKFNPDFWTASLGLAIRF
jgi:hypothetical protein